MATAEFDVLRVRDQFPLLKEKMHDCPLIYLDNAATTQKPQCVIDAIVRYYTHDNANVARGVYQLAEQAYATAQAARQEMQGFLHAAAVEEIIFTAGTTASSNLVAHSYGYQHVRRGDRVLVTALDHHANFVPWQSLCKATGAQLEVVPVLPTGDLDMVAFEQAIARKPKIVALPHVSSVLGTVVDVTPLIAQAHAQGAVVMVDAAQSAPQLALDVQALDCDFLVLSVHKMYGPTGLGALYGKKALLAAMPPYQVGGGMVDTVTPATTTYASLPHKLEAGTPNLAGLAGLAAAVRFIKEIGIANIHAHENRLLQQARGGLQQMDNVVLVGSPREQAGILSFTVKGIHSLDVGLLLDSHGIAVRTGNHCCQPLMQALGIEGTIRLSFGAYNTMEEVDRFLAVLEKIVHK